MEIILGIQLIMWCGSWKGGAECFRSSLILSRLFLNKARYLMDREGFIPFLRVSIVFIPASQVFSLLLIKWWTLLRRNLLHKILPSVDLFLILPGKNLMNLGKKEKLEWQEFLNFKLEGGFLKVTQSYKNLRSYKKRLAASLPSLLGFHVEPRKCLSVWSLSCVTLSLSYKSIELWFGHL